MLSITRINDIRSQIQQKNSVLVSELAKKYKVTEETIRRDLKKLEEQGVLTRVYGGAYNVNGVQNDVDIDIRQSVLLDEKKTIAKRAFPIIIDGDSIFLDSSTTALQLALLLKELNLTVITNSFPIAQVLSEHENIHLIVLGGSLNNKSMSFIGQSAKMVLSNYFVDKAFISCRSLSLRNGITDSNEEQGAIRRIALERSEKAYLLIDHTKFGPTSFVHIADVSQLSAVITDQPLSTEWTKLFQSKSLKVIVE